MNDDYVALDLGRVCNATPAAVPGLPPAGRRMFRGIPFLIGPSTAVTDPATPALIVLGGNATVPITIPIDCEAHWLLFAHRLLETTVFEDGRIGATVADYVIHYADGAEERVPIRERFEIGHPDERWTQAPFRAWWDREYTMPPRLAGPWEAAGARQTEGDFPGAPDYSLYPWPNRRPAERIAAVEVVPHGQRFVLAAVTRSPLPEHPFRLPGPRDVVVTLPAGEAGEVDHVFDPSHAVDAAAAANLAVAVDRGMATFPFALPAASADAYLTSGRPGWGEAANVRPSPVWLRVAAVPSATLSVAAGDRELGQARWGDLEDSGAVETGPGVRIELVDRGRNWVRTTVVDAETGLPIPCRIHVRTPEGVPCQPHGHHAHVNSNNGTWHIDVGGDVRLGQATYAYVDGSCEGWLPRGDVLVDVAQGFEYEPLRTRLTIEPGQQELRLSLRRWTDMNARGWWSGDTHVHFLSPSGGLFEARGEGLNVVNLLLAQWGHLFTNTEDFTGRPHASPDGRTVLWASQENRQHMLGHMGLLGLRHPVMPWSSDGLGEAEPAGTLETTMSDWADRCHEQGGTVVTPHFPSPNGETATLIATGRTDAIEMIRHGQYEHATWYRYLNAGYRLPVVGGTDKMSSDVPVGLYRTYVRIPPDEPFSHDAWCRNLRLGRTFQTGGPILDFHVDGHEIGDTLTLPAGGGTVEVEASAESIFPLHALELVHDGRVIASATSEAGTRRLGLREHVRMEDHGWLAVRAGGPGYWQSAHHHDAWGRQIFAHSSPVYVAVGEPWRRHDPEMADQMLTLIAGALGYIRDVSPQFEPGRASHHHGEADHLAYLERPFHEAEAAVRRRMAEAAERSGG